MLQQSFDFLVKSYSTTGQKDDTENNNTINQRQEPVGSSQGQNAASVPN